MNPLEACKLLEKHNVDKINLGSVFIDDIVGISEEADEKEYLQSINNIDKLDLDSRWYLPFDTVTHLVVFEDFKKGVDGVVFVDNPEHKLSSPIEFSCINEEATICGTVTLRLAEDVKTNDRIETSRKYPGTIIYNRYLYENSSKYVVTIIFTKVTFVDVMSGKITRVKSFNLNIISKYVHDKINNILSKFSGQIIHAFAYFTKLLINTKLFVVEEKVVSNKNGIMCVSKHHQSLFRTVDIKTLNTRYLKNNNSISNVALKNGYPRRRHDRVLRSDYFGSRQGEVIVVNACWVGPTERFDSDKNRFYKVRLDVG